MVQQLGPKYGKSAFEGLLSGLGKGFASGVEETGQNYLKELLETKKNENKGLTPYQTLSSDLRAKEQNRMQLSAINNELIKIASDYESGIPLGDVPNISQTIKASIENGIAPEEAFSSAITGYQMQGDILKNAAIPKYKEKNLEASVPAIMQTLKDDDITDKNLINKRLTKLNYPPKVRRQILDNLNKKIKFDPQNPSHVEEAKKVFSSVNGDVEKGNKLLSEKYNVSK